MMMDEGCGRGRTTGRSLSS